MGIFCINAAAVVGLEAIPITVEADISNGLPKFHLVGLPDAATSEARERVKAAIKNSDLPYPRTVVTVNLAPAHVRKHGPAYDVAIAMSILIARGLFKDCPEVENILFLGELALNGDIRPVRGILPCVLMAKENGFKGVAVPKANTQEALLIEGIDIYPVANLRELVDGLENHTLPLAEKTPAKERAAQRVVVDFKDIHGQYQAKRALEIAAAGGHNVLLSGSPGSGKTLLARAFPSILPEPPFSEALEMTVIHSVAGLLKSDYALVRERPFRAPHHSASSTALVGGGSVPKPGEISLAHRGVLFLDELPEFHRQALENLRQPLEEGVVTISRATGSITFPARFTLLAAMNPCPCGYAFDKEKTCTCSPHAVHRYRQKISGPLLDRIDIVLDVPRLPLQMFSEKIIRESSETIRTRVEKARERAQARYKNELLTTNAELSSSHIKKYCVLTDEDAAFLSSSAETLKLSARAYVRLLKVARTIADLAGSDQIERPHLVEALQFRSALSADSRTGS